jgi:hypothetical protein
LARAFGDPIETGSRLSAERYGMLNEGMSCEFIERFEFAQMRPLVRRPPGDDESSRAAFEAMVAADPALQM